MSLTRALLLLLVAPVALGGCFGGPLGSACEGEGDCDFGLRCFTASQLDGGICTVRCEQACGVGTCTTTEHGTLCLRACSVPGECPANQRCQAASGSESAVCWGLDGNLAPITGEEGIFVPPTGDGRPELVRVEITQDENGDLAVSAGESVTLALYLRNAGGDALTGLAGALTSHASAATIARCMALGAGYCSDRTSLACSCLQNSNGMTLDLEPGGVGQNPLLEVDIDVASSAGSLLAFELQVVDAGGQEWLLTFEVPVVTTSTNVQLTRYAVTRDTNGDGLVNPGENVELDVFVANPGIEPALDVWASVAASTPVSIDRCMALGGGYCSDRTATACSCAANSNSLYAEVPGQLSTEIMLITVELDLEPGAAVGIAALPMTFGDRFGNTWTDTLELAVVATGARPEVASVLVDDGFGDGDGVLDREETAEIGVVLRNAGTSAATALWAEVTSPSSSLQLKRCDALGGAYCSDRQVSRCSCEGNASSLYQDVGAGETAQHPVITFDLEALAGAPTGNQRFLLVLGDELGNRWPTTFDVWVAP